MTIIQFPTRPRVRNVADDDRWESLRPGGARHRILYERFEDGEIRLEAMCGKTGWPQTYVGEHDCRNCLRLGWTPPLTA